jgi:hypothetical protein
MPVKGDDAKPALQKLGNGLKIFLDIFGPPLRNQHRPARLALGMPAGDADRQPVGGAHAREHRARRDGIIRRGDEILREHGRF